MRAYYKVLLCFILAVSVFAQSEVSDADTEENQKSILDISDLTPLKSEFEGPDLDSEHITLKAHRKKWKANVDKFSEVIVGLKNTESSQSILALGDINDDIYTDLITIRGDDKFVVYLYHPTEHKFIQTGKVYDAECDIESINIARVSSKNRGIFLKCIGKGVAPLKAYQFIREEESGDFLFKQIQNKQLMISNQPFIADFNGDSDLEFLPDILFHDEEGIKIAFQTQNPQEWNIHNLDDAIGEK